MYYLGKLLWREYQLVCRQRSEIVLPWLFLLLIICLFPLGVTADPVILRQISPGIVWVGLFTGQLFALEKLFRLEMAAGIFEQWLLLPVSFPYLIFVRILANWLMYCIPLLLFVPMMGLWLPLSTKALAVLALTLLLATPILHFMGAIFSALTIKLRNNGLLLGLLAFPFYLPVLVFATTAVSHAQAGLPIGAPLAFLGALLMITLPLAPLAAAAALRLMLQ